MRARNKRLMVAAAAVQDQLERHKQVETYQATCWKSSDIVIMGKRVSRVTYSAATGETTLVFFPDWWNAHFSADKDTIGAAVREQIVAL